MYAVTAIYGEAGKAQISIDLMSKGISREEVIF